MFWQRPSSAARTHHYYITHAVTIIIKTDTLYCNYSAYVYTVLQQLPLHNH